jgi:hypothetical protein
MRTEPDKTLAILANRLSILRFTPDLSHELEHEIIHVRAAKGFKNCYAKLGKLCWGVKLYLAGKQRTFGVTADVVTAVRFADVIIHEFWSDRVNTHRPITNEDLNISIVQAKADLINNPEVSLLVKDIKSHCMERGYTLTDSGKRDKEFSRQVAADRLSVINAFRSTIRVFQTNRSKLNCIPNSGEINRLLEDKFDDLGKTLVSWGKIEL